MRFATAFSVACALSTLVECAPLPRVDAPSSSALAQAPQLSNYHSITSGKSITSSQVKSIPKSSTPAISSKTTVAPTKQSQIASKKPKPASSATPGKTKPDTKSTQVESSDNASMPLWEKGAIGGGTAAVAVGAAGALWWKNRKPKDSTNNEAEKPKVDEANTDATSPIPNADEVDEHLDNEIDDEGYESERYINDHQDVKPEVSENTPNVHTTEQSPQLSIHEDAPFTLDSVASPVGLQLNADGYLGSPDIDYAPGDLIPGGLGAFHDADGYDTDYDGYTTDEDVVYKAPSNTPADSPLGANTERAVPEAEEVGTGFLGWFTKLGKNLKG